MVNELSEVNTLLTAKEIILRKKMISMIEHYDVEDRDGTRIGEAEGNLFQIRPKFVVKDIYDSKLMYIEGKTFSLTMEFSFYDNAGKFLGTMKNKLLKLKGQEYLARAKRNRTHANLWEFHRAWLPDGGQWSPSRYCQEEIVFHAR